MPVNLDPADQDERNHRQHDQHERRSPCRTTGPRRPRLSWARLATRKLTLRSVPAQIRARLPRWRTNRRTRTAIEKRLIAICSRLKGEESAREVRRRERQPAQERRQRNVTVSTKQHAERHHRTAHEIGIECQHGPHAGRDSLAASELEINRKRMTQDRRQRHQHRQVGRCAPVKLATSEGKPNVGRNPLSMSSRKTSRK